MRLTAVQSRSIREAVRAVAGADSRVRLFGSRTDDAARGGDIDLLVEVDQPVQSAVLLAARIAVRVQHAIGDRRVDVLVAAPNLADGALIRAARDRGIEL